MRGGCEDQNRWMRNEIVQKGVAIDEIKSEPIRETNVVDDEVY